MKISVQRISVGLHPDEVVVAVQTPDKLERLMVDKRSLDGNMLEIGFPVGQRDDLYLVELPQETFSGYWRVWVLKTAVVADMARERAVA